MATCDPVDCTNPAFSTRKCAARAEAQHIRRVRSVCSRHNNHAPTAHVFVGREAHNGHANLLREERLGAALELQGMKEPKEPRNLEV